MASNHQAVEESIRLPKFGAAPSPLPNLYWHKEVTFNPELLTKLWRTISGPISGSAPWQEDMFTFKLIIKLLILSKI